MIYAYTCKKCGAEFTLSATLAEKERGLDLSCPRCGAKDVEQDFRGIGMAFGGRGSGGEGPRWPGCGPGAGCC